MSTDVEPQAPALGLPTSRGETISKVGTVVSAVVASSCCWLPLLLLAVGVSGAGIASTLAAYRPIFMVVTFGFLGAAFYFTYRPHSLRKAQNLPPLSKGGIQGGSEQAAAHADCCAPQAVEVDCCGRPVVKPADCCSAPAAGAKRRFNMMALNKAMLWAVTAMAIFFLFFPGYLARLMGAGGGTVTADMQQTVLKVDGMTCEGCAPIAAEAIKKAPGVLAVEVDYDKRLATIGTRPGQSVPQKAILASLNSVGFRGKFVEK